MAGCTGATGITGTQYTYAQLEGLWINAGGPKAVAPIAAAIAEAESGGCSAAVNALDSNGEGGTQTSWGLWQISNGTHSQPVAGILNPATNAQQAVAKYTGNNDTFGDWGTYTSGAYKAYLNNSTTPDTDVPSPSSSSSASSSGSSSSSADCAFGPDLPVVGTVCLVKKSTIRHAAGLALMTAGGLIGALGVLLLAAFAFRASGAQQALRDTREALPGHATRERTGPSAQKLDQLTGTIVREGTTGQSAAARRQQSAASSAARQRAAEGRRQAAAAERRERYERGTVTTEERTPIDGEMGGTRRTVTRRPGPRPDDRA